MLMVRQNNHETCQQACIAMLAGVRLRDVCALVGDRALGTAERRAALDHFGIKYPEGEAAHVINEIDGQLSKFMREHPLLWGDVNDWKNPDWGHAVVIWRGHLYDPWRGIDPDWPWTRHIWKVWPVLHAPAAS